jgi:hypothetical protein
MSVGVIPPHTDPFVQITMFFLFIWVVTPSAPVWSLPSLPLPCTLVVHNPRRVYKLGEQWRTLQYVRIFLYYISKLPVAQMTTALNDW